ncbi:hypothetical protein [Desulfurococcus mucosus]|uniref:Uncharacterized protein n=1 Tax=Desulfurococcus mucosus (strain ATCC 35584 / DSM 2162 / JCM 9187 / O7/1) TaxID=765177 RepID=E8R8F8_DESM0|nr:hypothetical protein [Desulfurococcus mucosus]ADV64784.1 hypothetical protein Desmu_0471 [Desulfurococcus mucosus DSM 2162]
MGLKHVALYSIPVTVTPEPPPGIGEAVSRILSWLYWLAWMAVAGAGVYGVLKTVMGDTEEGRRLILGAVAGAVLLAFLWVIISALVS